MDHIPNQNRSDQELTSIFKIVMETALARDSYGSKNISGSQFDRVCQELYGSSVRGVIRTRFATRGKNTGFNELKNIHGYRVLPSYTHEDIIEIYYKAYSELKTKLDRKDPWPRETDIVKNSISMHAVYTKFGTHLNAVREMVKVKRIKRKITIPSTVVLKRRDRIGDDISKYEIGLNEAPTNEMGVVAVFSVVHSLIGFPSIIKIQQEFPDCVAECNRDGKFRAKIEFKMYSSIAFKKQSQRIETWKSKDVDYLICWVNNSPKVTNALLNMGIGVISLKEELAKLFDAALLRGKPE